MIFRSPYPDVTIPEMALTPFVLRRANQLAGKPALIDGLSGRTITYSQLVSRVRRTAKSLVSRGYRKGDVFAIHSANLPEYAVAFHAIATIGGIVTTVNPRHTAGQLADQLNDAGAKCLITTSQFSDQALAATERSNVREVFAFDHTGDALPFVELFESVMEPSEAPTNALIDPRNDLAALPYSSGGAGFPKGVMRAHYSLVANLCQFDAVSRIDESDVVIGVIPFFHAYGMFMLMMHALWRGVTVVTLPRFDPEPFLRAVEVYRVTKAYLAPPILIVLARHPMVDRFDLSSLNLITAGSAPRGENVALECERRLHCPVRQGYGMAELGPVNNVNNGADAADRPRSAVRCSAIRRSTGRLLPNVEARIVDIETGGELGVNQQGELCFRGPHLMAGYLNRPEETARAIDSEGWLRTGDVGYVDDEGYFYVVDRIGKLIKHNGTTDRATPLPSSSAIVNWQS
ncbi:MAG: AMP-binding protein [Blastocatellia bacterium]